MLAEVLRGVAHTASSAGNGSGLTADSTFNGRQSQLSAVLFAADSPTLPIGMGTWLLLCRAEIQNPEFLLLH